MHRDLAFGNEMGLTKIDINISSILVTQKLSECICANLNQERVKLLPRGYEHMVSMAR